MDKPLEKVVANYLHEHPDFLVENRDLLININLPHDVSGNIISLIEHQTRIQREEIHRLRTTIGRLEQQSENFYRVLRTIHKISKLFMTGEPVQESADNFRRELKTEFDADETRLLIFMQKPFPDLLENSGVIATTTNDKRKTFFLEVFNRKKALCGILQEELMVLLFGKGSNVLYSTILYPLTTDSSWTGLVAIASNQHDRYQQGPETELFTLFCDLFSYSLTPVINKSVN